MDDRYSWRHRHFGLVEHLLEGEGLVHLIFLLHEESRRVGLVYDAGALQRRFVWLCGGVFSGLFLWFGEAVVEQESIVACRLELIVKFVDGKVNVFHLVVASSYSHRFLFSTLIFFELRVDDDPFLVLLQNGKSNYRRFLSLVLRIFFCYLMSSDLKIRFFSFLAMLISLDILLFELSEPILPH